MLVWLKTTAASCFGLALFDEDAAIQALIVDDGSTPPIVAPEVSGMCVKVLRMLKNAVSSVPEDRYRSACDTWFSLRGTLRRGRSRRALGASRDSVRP